MLHKYSFVSIFKITLLLFLFIPLLFSCNKFDGDQTIPSYIHIDKITVVDNPTLNAQSFGGNVLYCPELKIQDT